MLATLVEVRTQAGAFCPKEQTTRRVDGVADGESVLMAVEDKESSNLNGTEMVDELDPGAVWFDLSFPSSCRKSDKFRRLGPELSVPPEFVVSLFVDDTGFWKLLLNPLQPLLYSLKFTNQIALAWISFVR